MTLSCHPDRATRLSLARQFMPRRIAQRRKVIYCHPDRSDPAFSCAPICGAPGRGAEGSRHHLAAQALLSIFHFRVSR